MQAKPGMRDPTDEGLEWESYQFGRTVFSKSAGIEHELE